MHITSSTLFPYTTLFRSNKMEVQLLIEELRAFFEDETIEKIGQNLKNDLKTLAKYELSVKGKLFDTMLAHYLINPDMRHDLDRKSTRLNSSHVRISYAVF